MASKQPPLNVRIVRYRSEPNLTMDLKINEKVYRYEGVNRFDEYVIRNFLRKRQPKKVLDYVKLNKFEYKDITEEYQNFLTGLRNLSNPLQEFTIKDFKNASSSTTRTHRVVRNVVKGQEVRLAKAVDYDFNKNILVLLTPPTFKAPSPSISNGIGRPILKSLYMMQIQFVDLDKWKDKPWGEMTVKDFLDILKVCDIKMDCSDMSFQFQGMRYKLSRLKSAIYPTNIPDPVWGPRHQNKNGLCKHLLGLITDFEKMAPQILDKIKQVAKTKKIDQQEVKPVKPVQKAQPFKPAQKTEPTKLTNKETNVKVQSSKPPKNNPVSGTGNRQNLQQKPNIDTGS